MSRMTKLIYLIVALLCAAPASAQERLALVIGNANYQNVLTLDNPVNDAQLMARTLGEAGFQVTTLADADLPAMVQAVERFGREVHAAGPGALVLFYYAGHGVRSEGFNYLVPLGVDIRVESDIPREMVAAEWVLEQIDAPGAISVMVLDACRDNPFDGQGPRAIPELGDGLARMTAKNSNLIAYATGPGDAAFDGAGQHSPYTAALVRAIKTPGLDIEEIFAQVRGEVKAETAGLQIPWESSALQGAVYLQPGQQEAASAEEARLSLSVTFSPGRWGGGSLGCNTVYRYDPVRLPLAGGRTRRIGAVNANGEVALELAQNQEGAISIVPVSVSKSGRAFTAELVDITPGREHALYTRSRHPERFGCGAMTVYLRREG